MTDVFLEEGRGKFTQIQLAQGPLLVKKQTLQNETFELELIIDLFYMFLLHMVVMYEAEDR